MEIYGKHPTKSTDEAARWPHIGAEVLAERYKQENATIDPQPSGGLMPSIRESKEEDEPEPQAATLKEEKPAETADGASAASAPTTMAICTWICHSAPKPTVTRASV